MHFSTDSSYSENLAMFEVALVCALWRSENELDVMSIALFGSLKFLRVSS